MTSIYQQAASVLVWLGPSADDSDRAMDSIARYGRLAFEAGLLHLPREILMKWPDVGDDPVHLQTKAKVLDLLATAKASECDATQTAERFARVAFATLTHRP
jgi:hypothetical protein